MVTVHRAQAVVSLWSHANLWQVFSSVQQGLSASFCDVLYKCCLVATQDVEGSRD